MFEKVEKIDKRQEESFDILEKKIYKDILEKILEGKNEKEKGEIIQALVQNLEKDLLNLLNSPKEIKEVA